MQCALRLAAVGAPLRIMFVSLTESVPEVRRKSYGEPAHENHSECGDACVLRYSMSRCSVPLRREARDQGCQTVHHDDACDACGVFGISNGRSKPTREHGRHRSDPQAKKGEAQRERQSDGFAPVRVLQPAGPLRHRQPSYQLRLIPPQALSQPSSTSSTNPPQVVPGQKLTGTVG